MTNLDTESDKRLSADDLSLTLADRLLTAWSRAGVCWTLLRPDDMRQEIRDGEIDVLVDALHVGRAGDLSADAGFTEIPSWGRGSHRFFRAYDPSRDTWTTIDVVTRIDLGRYQELTNGLAPGFLERRFAHGELWRLDPDDQLWALLLHALLDKERIDSYADALCRLAQVATRESPDSSDSPAAACLAAMVGRDLVDRLRQAAHDGGWVSADVLRTELRARWPRTETAKRYVVTGRQASRHATKALVAVRRPGLTIALLGPDGAGKSSLADALVSAWPLPASRMYAGHYGAQRVLPRNGALAFGVQISRQVRDAVTGSALRRRGRLVVFDRYAYDARLPRATTHTATRLPTRLRRWALGHLTRRPDLVVVLDAPGDVLHTRSKEHSAEHLEGQRQAYRRLAEKVPHSVVVDATQPPHVVRQQVTAQAWQRQSQIWAG